MQSSGYSEPGHPKVVRKKEIRQKISLFGVIITILGKNKAIGALIWTLIWILSLFEVTTVSEPVYLDLTLSQIMRKK